MFKFLKNKLKETVKKFSKKAEEESEEVEEDNLSEENLSALDAEKQEVENKENVTSKNEFKSVDELIPDESKDESESKVNSEPLVEEETEVEPKPQEKISKDIEEVVVQKELSKGVKEEKEESKVEESESEVDPLIEEVIESNKSFEEAEQQSANAPEHPDPIEPELIDEDITKEEIVDDHVEDNDVVEDIIALDTEDVKDISDEPEEKKGFFKRIFSKKESEEDVEKPIEEKSEELIESEPDVVSKPIVKEEKKDEPQEVVVEEKEPELKDKSNSIKEAVHKELLSEDVGDATKKKKGFFGKLKDRVVKFQLTDEVFEELFWDFELALLEGNVAGAVIEKIKSDLKEKLTSENVSRKEVGDVIFETLKNSLDEILSVPTFDLIQKIKDHKKSSSQNSDSRSPFVICIVGVNGSGKTTTLAKLINLFQKKDLSLVVAAADTFRAAAIQQLEEHTNKLGVKLIKHDYNADPAAVAFDAIKHAQAKNLDVVLIDTAGRLQSNSNLMDELRKLVRVNKPDLTLFIGESITGNDCVEQAVAFNEAVNIDGIILSKADVDEKGGAAISVSYVTKKPILYLGTGQTYDDLKLFNKEEMLETLGL